MDKDQDLTIVDQFENSSIRKVWHQGEWWFSLVDVMSIFAGTNRARQYWHDLKKRILREDANKTIIANIKQLKLKTIDQKCYKSDVTNLTTVIHILQYASLPITGRSPRPSKSEIEKSIENTLANDLRSLGLAVKQQVQCVNGRADIVTNEAIYEVKAFLTRDCLYKAIGQLFSYQAKIDPSAKLFIVGCKPEDRHKQDLEVNIAESLGIEVIIWDRNKRELSVPNRQLKVV